MLYCFSRNGGNLGTPGSLQFIFDHKSIFEVPVGDIDEDEFMLSLIDAGAEDIEIEEGSFVITAEKEDFGAIQSKLEEMGITPEEASLERIPTTYKKVDEETLEQLYKLIDVIEEDDDVIRVFHNLEEVES